MTSEMEYVLEYRYRQERLADGKVAMAIKKNINLSDLKGTLSNKGRERYQDPELAQAFRELLAGEIPNVVMDDLFKVTAKTTEKTITNERAKWRNRAVSVFDSLESGRKISVSWSDEQEMVIVLASSDEASE